MFITYKQLIFFGVHIGHSLRNTLLFSSWMLLGFRQKVWIINLYQTIYMLKIAFKFIRQIVWTNGPIWFINLEKTKADVLNFYSKICGEFYCSSSWLRGILSNYFQIFNSFKKSLKYSELVKNHKDKVNDFIYKNWFITRFSWPRAIFVSSAFHSSLALKEALSINIPSIAIIDTNTKSHFINIGIPGNDDSMESVSIFNYIIANYILINKYKFIFLWFVNTRKSERILSLSEWLLNYKNNKVDMSTYYFYNLKVSTLLFLGIRTFFARDAYSKIFSNKHLFDKAKDWKQKLEKIELIFSKTHEVNNLMLRIYFFKGVLRYKTFLKTKIKIKKVLRIQNFFTQIASDENFFFKFYNLYPFKYSFKKDNSIKDDNYKTLWSSIFFTNIKYLNQKLVFTFLKTYFRIFIKHFGLNIASYNYNKAKKIQYKQFKFLNQSLNLGKKDLTNQKPKFRFLVGWWNFGSFLPKFLWNINPNISYLARIPSDLFWYFWRFYHNNYYDPQKSNYNHYYGPHFYKKLYNFYIKTIKFFLLIYNYDKILIKKTRAVIALLNSNVKLLILVCRIFDLKRLNQKFLWKIMSYIKI